MKFLSFSSIGKYFILLGFSLWAGVAWLCLRSRPWLGPPEWGGTDQMSKRTRSGVSAPSARPRRQGNLLPWLWSQVQCRSSKWFQNWWHPSWPVSSSSPSELLRLWGHRRFRNGQAALSGNSGGTWGENDFKTGFLAPRTLKSDAWSMSHRKASSSSCTSRVSLARSQQQRPEVYLRLTTSDLLVRKLALSYREHPEDWKSNNRLIPPSYLLTTPQTVAICTSKTVNQRSSGLLKNFALKTLHPSPLGSLPSSAWLTSLLSYPLCSLLIFN